MENEVRDFIYNFFKLIVISIIRHLTYLCVLLQFTGLSYLVIVYMWDFFMYSAFGF